MYVIIATAALAQWGYDGLQSFGPKEWYKVSLECEADKQSPINIKTQHVKTAKDGIAILWVPIMTQGSLPLSHQDSLIKLDIRSRRAILSSTGLPENMLLAELILHSGSEHSIDGEVFQVEAQFVFEPADIQYLPNTRHPKVVISILFDASGTASGFGIVRHVIEQSSRVPRNGDIAHITWNSTYGTDFRRNNGRGEYDRLWLDLTEETFYEYEGSLTTPPCHETVRWMVAKDVRFIDEMLLTALENVIDSLKGNNRPIKPTNGRPIVKKHYASAVSKGRATDFIELSLVAAEYQRDNEVPQGDVYVAYKEDDDSAGLIAAIVILSLSIVGTVIATIITLSLKHAKDGFDEVEMSDKGDEEEEDEEDEEDEEEEEEEDEEDEEDM